MKRYLCLLLGLLLLTGCGGKQQNPTEDTTLPLKTMPTLPETTLPETTAAPVLEPRVVYERDGIVLTVTGLQEDWMGTRIDLLLENNTDRNIALSGDVFVVNGVTVPGYLYAEAAAGKKTNDALELYSDALERAKITELATVRTGDARIVDTDSFDIVDRVEIHLETDRAEGHHQEIDESGEVLFEQEDVTVIARFISGELFGQTVELLVKNQMPRDIIVEAENISVNDFTLDAWLYETVCAETVRYCDLELFSTSLEQNGITQIEKISFTLHILNAQTLETITKSETLEIFVRG